jgi:lysophospholipase L1-like esterase
MEDLLRGLDSCPALAHKIPLSKKGGTELRSFKLALKRLSLVIVLLAAPAFAIFLLGPFYIYKWYAENKWRAELTRLEESDRQNPPAKGGVLFIGSSSIKLWHTLTEDFPGTKVINRGIGGSQLSDSILLADRIVTPHKPTTVVLYAGENDLVRGKTPRQVLEGYKAFLARIHRTLPATKIAFISIKPSPARESLLPAIAEANGLIKAYTSSDSRLTYIDVFTPMLNSGGRPRSELFAADGLHLNREGYNLWKSLIAPYLHSPSAQPPDDP